MLDDWLKQLGYDAVIKKRVAPLLKLVEEDKIDKFEKEICRFTLEVLKEIKEEKLLPEAAQDLFMVIDLYITKKNLRDRLKKIVQDLLFETLLFHDFGTVHGPDLDFMRTLACKRLGKSC